MAVVHLMLQGKGGVGKSFAAALLFQYLRDNNLPVYGYDTDPINCTFAGYREFNITTVEIMNGDDIDPRGFDRLIESICALEAENAQAVVDNGSSCFPPLCGYLKENEALEILKDQGHEVIMHSVVTGGQALGDTLSGLKSLTTHFQDTPIAVWLNPYYGEIVLDGSDFYEFRVYAESSANFKGVIELPTLKPNTFGRDLAGLLAQKISFEAAIKSSLSIMTRQRLAMIRRKINQAIDRAYLI